MSLKNISIISNKYIFYFENKLKPTMAQAIILTMVASSLWYCVPRLAMTLCPCNLEILGLQFTTTMCKKDTVPLNYYKFGSAPCQAQFDNLFGMCPYKSNMNVLIYNTNIVILNQTRRHVISSVKESCSQHFLWLPKSYIWCSIQDLSLKNTSNGSPKGDLGRL